MLAQAVSVFKLNAGEPTMHAQPVRAVQRRAVTARSPAKSLRAKPASATKALATPSVPRAVAKPKNVAGGTSDEWEEF